MTEKEFRELNLLEKLKEKGLLINGRNGKPRPVSKQKALDFLQSEVGVIEPFIDIKEVLLCILHNDFPLNHKCPICGKRLYFVSLNGDDRYNKFCSEECAKSHTVESIYNSIPPQSLIEKFNENMTFGEFRNFCKLYIFKNGNSPKTQRNRAYFKYFSERLLISNNWRSIPEFMWCIVNDDQEEHKYCECGKEVIFSEVTGRRKTCGNKDCSEKYAHTEESYDRRHQTCLDKYGVDHFSKTEEYKQKYQSTSIERYGAPSFMSNPEQRLKSFQSYFEKTGYHSTFENPQTKEKAKESLQKHLKEDPELYKKAGKKAVETYKQRDPNYEKRNTKVKETIERNIAENPNFWKDRWAKSQETLEKTYQKIGSKELYEKMRTAQREESLIAKYGSLEEYYNYRTLQTRKKYKEEFGVESYRYSKEFKEKYHLERECQLKEFRKNNPNVYPMDEITLLFSDIFDKYNIIPYRQIIIITSILDKYKIQINEYLWGNGDMSKRFHGCEILDIKEFKKKFNTTVEEECITFFKNSFRSKGEKKLFNYIQSLIGDEAIINNSRAVLTDEDGNSQELDIYLPSRKIAFEYNGTYWHSLKIVKSEFYHLNKTRKCKELGIQLIHIWDYEWLFETEKIKTFLRNILLPKVKISARKCILEKVSNSEEEEFLNAYHLDGYKESLICYGLYFQGTLLQVMSFNNFSNSSVAQFEMIRLCTKEGYAIYGGAERLFQQFLLDYNPQVIVSYCNRDKFHGNVYNKLNFVSQSLRPLESLVKIGNSSYDRITEEKVITTNKIKLIEDSFCDTYTSGIETFIWEK